MPRLRFHGNQTCMKETQHRAQGVESAHFCLIGALVIVKQRHLVRQVHIVVDRIDIAIKLLLQMCVFGAFLSQFLNEIRNDFPIFIPSRLLAGPVFVETVLQRAHLAQHRLFCIRLQVGVKSGIDFQT